MDSITDFTLKGFAPYTNTLSRLDRAIQLVKPTASSIENQLLGLRA
jgi:hypothetical protein